MIWYDFGPIRTSGSIVSTLTLHSLTGTLKGPGPFDSVAPPGGQIQQYVSFSALFESPTKDMAQKYGSTVKNLT